MTFNIDFAGKKLIFDWKIDISADFFPMWISEFTDKKSKNNEGRLFSFVSFVGTIKRGLRQIRVFFLSKNTDLARHHVAVV